jgi:hypothetical protein
MAATILPLVPNGTPVRVTPGRVAHRSAGLAVACDRHLVGVEMVTFAQALVYLRPTWCQDPRCFGPRRSR